MSNQVLSEIKLKKNNGVQCPRCGKDMIFKEYTTDFYQLSGSACPACGYFLIREGWVDSLKIGMGKKGSFQPKGTS